MSDEDPPVQDRLEAIGAATLGDDPPPEAVEAVLRRWTESLEDVGPLRLKLERDALADLPGLSAGAVDAALEERARDETGQEAEPEDEEPDPERVREWWEESKEILTAVDQLKLFRHALADVGYAGGTTPAELVHVALHSRNLDRPIGLVLKGPSAAGKTFTVNTARRFHPADAVLSLEGMSPRFLAYTDHPTEHRYVLVAEGDAIQSDGVGVSLIRSLAWSQEIKYGTVKTTPKGPEPVTIRKPGPTGLLTTSTSALQEEIETRLISLPITDEPRHTRDVIRTQAEEAEGERVDGPDLSAWVAASRLLAGVGDKEVVIPFASTLAEAVPAERVRMRRDFRQVLMTVRSLALMHQARRERDGEGRVVANEFDYLNAKRLLSSVLDATQSEVTDAVRDAVEAVDRLNEEKLGHEALGVSFKELGDELGLTRQGAYYRAKKALKRGFLANTEERRGYPARLVTADPLPAEAEVLPERKAIFGSGPLPDIPKTGIEGVPDEG